LENVRAAWQWAIGMAKVEEIYKAAQTLAWFCQFQSRYLEAAGTFEKAVHGLAGAEATPQRELALAIVLVELAWFYIRLGRLDQAEAAIEQSQAIYERLGVPPVLGQATDPRLPLGIIASIRGDYVTAAQLGADARRVSEAHNHRGNLPFALYLLTRASLAAGDLEAARRYAQQACAIVEQAGDRWFLAYCLNELGHVASALGDHAQAQQHYQSSYAIRQAFDDPEGMALALNHLGKIALLQEDYRQAEQLYRQSLTTYQQINDRGGLATSLYGLAMAACALRDPPAARQHFQQALQIAMDIQFVSLTLSVLMGIGQLLLSYGQPERGIELLAFVRQHPASERETRDRAQQCLEHYRAELAPELFAAASQRGQQGDLQTVAGALQTELPSLELSSATATPISSRPAPLVEQPLVEPLTLRELEVLRLIADGLTNQQIAESLIISVGTVKFYTSQIYGKLSVGSRTQAVAHARDLGLLS
jgi:ATP/maltotriose-dependent transcriptional regulator MalT